MHDAPPGSTVAASLAKTPDPAAALIAIATEYVTSRKDIHRKLGASRYLTPATAGSLPLAFTANHGNTPARAAVADLLAQHLTSDEAWRTFETLSAAFHGSLNDLLTACGYILD